MQQFFRGGRWLSLSQMKEYNASKSQPKKVKEEVEEQAPVKEASNKK